MKSAAEQICITLSAWLITAGVFIAVSPAAGLLAHIMARGFLAGWGLL